MMLGAGLPPPVLEKKREFDSWCRVRPPEPGVTAPLPVLPAGVDADATFASVAGDGEVGADEREF